MREAATEAGATVLLYEGGEALRFDPAAIATGRDGTLRVLAEIGIIPAGLADPAATRFSRASRWMRTASSGILHLNVELGDEVEAGATIASIFDPFGKRLGRITARSNGLIIGHTQHPLVNRGDAVAHLAEI